MWFKPRLRAIITRAHLLEQHRTLLVHKTYLSHNTGLQFLWNLSLWEEFVSKERIRRSSFITSPKSLRVKATLFLVVFSIPSPRSSSRSSSFQTYRRVCGRPLSPECLSYSNICKERTFGWVCCTCIWETSFWCL